MQQVLGGGNDDMTASMMLDSATLKFDMGKAMTDINTSKESMK